MKLSSDLFCKYCVKYPYSPMKRVTDISRYVLGNNATSQSEEIFDF